MTQKSIYVTVRVNPHVPGPQENRNTRRRMARERKGAGSSVVSMETPYYKTIYQRCIIGRLTL